ncbi:uncharacterized protein BuS5_02904 [Desulfosarcina sp. BuS5]|uniref:Zn-ribbon domain-containing OB-fold protein n=1 Tax=Desulfosarcina sp. BuS5 TaxID=933262 RepID=UPI00068657FE|nr:OB-fold domain-containing protein [Desulfosarcina sp. BuS5]WDN89934.1 uncharacterized protein BuS5_02904 [Desulfosarcina sp. BuS5]
MVSTDITTIPLRKGFWTNMRDGNEQTRLIGSRCSSCGEIFFPKKEKNWCVHCNRPTLEETTLSNKGKIATYSVVMQQPGGGFYKGPVPYAYGCVDVEDGIRIETLLSADNFDQLEVDMDVELVIEKFYNDDDGNEVVTFKFKPV